MILTIIEPVITPTKKYKYKIFVLGDFDVGKTSLVMRYCNDTFSSVFVATDGYDRRIFKTIQMDNEIFELEICEFGIIFH